jgi:hypothetical protein
MATAWRSKPAPSHRLLCSRDYSALVALAIVLLAIDGLVTMAHAKQPNNFGRRDLVFQSLNFRRKILGRFIHKRQGFVCDFERNRVRRNMPRAFRKRRVRMNSPARRGRTFGRNANSDLTALRPAPFIVVAVDTA